MKRRAVFALVFVACSDQGDDSQDADDSGTPVAGWTGGPYALGGTLTWNAHFTDGTADCSYTQTYDATEDWTQPWTCPDCDVRFRADVTTTGGDCYASVHDEPPGPVAYLGVGEDGSFRLHAHPNYPLDAYGSTTLDGDALAVVGELVDERLTLRIEGTLERAPSSADPWHGFTPPPTYACGWPKADPPPYAGPWEFHINATVPDGWFRDPCDEVVRLHDFAGTYVVIDVSATDCGPCQQMALDEEAFASAMAIEGIEVHSVTLLAPSLAAVLDDTPVETLAAWMADYQIESAVLADRGWGYGIPERFLGVKTYPTWVVMAPDLRAVAIGNGYTSFDEIATRIRDDAK